MVEKIKIIVSKRDIIATFELSNESPKTIETLLKALPIKSTFNRWGDEALFDVIFNEKLERNARTNMNIGEVAFWPEGPSICIFFGPTPVSTNDQPKAYSPVNVIGKIIDSNPKIFQAVEDGDTVILEKI
jgi:hypothetical protein